MFRNIELLYGMNWFEKIKYRIEPGKDSLILVIDCQEKPKTMFFGSVHYDNALGSGILMSVSVKNIFLQGSEFNMATCIGEFYRADISAAQAMGRNQKFVFSSNFRTDKTLVPVLTLRGESGDWKSTNISTGISLNHILGLNHMLSLSIDYENRYLFPAYVSKSDIRHFGYAYLSSAITYQVNSLDNRHFPEKGNLLEIKAGVSDLMSSDIKIGKSETDYNPKNPGEFTFGSYYTLKGSWEHYFKMPGILTISLKSDILYLSSCDSLTSQNNFYLLGGMTAVNDRSVAMYGFHPEEIPVKQLAELGLGFDWKLTKELHINLAGNAAGIREANSDSGFSILAGYGVGLGYMSIIGPIRAGIMQGFYGEEKYFSKIKGYFSVGFCF
jgi:NTE family protein